MPILGDFGSALGFGDATEVNYPDPSENVSQQSRELARDARGQIENRLDPESFDPVARAIYGGSMRNIEGNRQRNLDTTTAELEKRGLQNSGIAVEAVGDVNRQANQQVSDLNRQIENRRFQNQTQAIQQALQNLQRERDFAQGQAQSQYQEDLQNQKLEQAKDQRLLKSVAGGASFLSTGIPDSSVLGGLN